MAEKKERITKNPRCSKNSNTNMRIPHLLQPPLNFRGSKCNEMQNMQLPFQNKKKNNNKLLNTLLNS